jgi:hypothetical protein
MIVPEIMAESSMLGVGVAVGRGVEVGAKVAVGVLVSGPLVGVAVGDGDVVVEMPAVGVTKAVASRATPTVGCTVMALVAVMEGEATGVGEGVPGALACA